MSDQPVVSKAADPLESWRDLRDVYMDAWAKAMGETVKSEAYAQASGAVLDTCLTASAPLRDAQKKAMLTTLEQLNMPSRAEFVSLAERLSNMEMLLDDMAAKIDQIFRATTGTASKAAPEAGPKRARVAAQPISEVKAESAMVEAVEAESVTVESVAESVQEVAKPVSESEVPEAEDESEAARASMKAVAEPEAEAFGAVASPVPEAKSETKSAVRREAAKSAKKGSK